MITTTWELKGNSEEEELKTFSKSLNNLHPVLTQILLNRGINSFEKAKDFFRPQLNQLFDPYLLKDMDKAVVRLNRAMSEGELIRIYGDYDVDGVTSVAMMYGALNNHYENLDYYIPDRYSEGYGISMQSIDDAAEKGVSLVIALDCGIKANEKIAYANEKGIDFIICDHHEPGTELPAAVAILDPKRRDCSYPFQGLSGCGVGFKLLQAFVTSRDLPFSAIEECLDLVAISIAADIVPIQEENRILAHYGLKQLNQLTRVGVKSMVKQSGVKHDLTIEDVVFRIAPKINAAGRLKSAASAVKVLIAEDSEAADDLGSYIQEQNENRRILDQQITAEALQMIKEDETLRNAKSTVVYQADWHKGVVGIVASRLMEEYYRPTIVLTASNGKITGSARSVKGFSVYDALEACSDVIEQFGGHMYAAGMTILPENLEAFKMKFEAVVSERITAEQLVPSIDVDATLSLKDIDQKFYRVLQQFAPFGPGNMNPVFLSKGVLAYEHKIVGDKHLKMKLFDPMQPERLFDAIGFGLGKIESQLSEGIPMDIVYTLELNHWMGRTTMQLNLKDIKVGI